MEFVEELLGAPWEALATEETESVFKFRERRRDKIKGMLFGGAIGDALGGPHEFRNQTPIAQYSGSLVHPITLCRRFQGGRLVGNIGQITDDTEMSMGLANAIILNGGYNSKTAAMNYLAWANSKCYFVGNNTRALFVGVKTFEGYRSRWEGIHGGPAATWSQSNGCLMRCAPLAALPDGEWKAAAEEDCKLTNPHPVCVDGVRAYVGALRDLLNGGSPQSATVRALELAQTADVIAVICEGRDQWPRVVDGQQKGWILHALYCAFRALNSAHQTYQDSIDPIIRLKGDTDTNGAIAGALLGALHGVSALMAEDKTGPNLQTVLSVCSTGGELPRPDKYAAKRLPAIADALADL